MAIRKVAVLGNPILREESLPLSQKEIQSTKIQALIRDMFETMFEYNGRGLAAPQIHENLQIVVMIWDFDEKKEPSFICLINPQITLLSKNLSAFWEGCLSLPGMRGKVSRPNKIRVEALNEKGEKVDFVAEEFAATVVQHEVDHLFGKLYIDRMTDLKELAFENEFRKFHAKDDESKENEG